MTARIVDLATGEALVDWPEVADNPWSRFRGLMFRSRLGKGEGLVLQPCGSIHMFFMRFPIDAVFFDREWNVTRVARGVRPWVGLAFGGRGAHGVIELPVGAARHVERGHALALEDAA